MLLLELRKDVAKEDSWDASLEEFEDAGQPLPE